MRKQIEQAIDAHQKLLTDNALHNRIEHTAIVAVQILIRGGRVLLCGNGGSAADAQHIAAELSGRYNIDRPALDVEALHCNTSYITAVANDYSFDIIYERLVEAKGREADMLIAISTSGNSENIIRAAEAAKRKKMLVVGLTGEIGGNLKDFCDILLNVPSSETPIIQQLHILVGHILCEKIEKAIYGNTNCGCSCCGHDE